MHPPNVPWHIPQFPRRGPFLPRIASFGSFVTLNH